MMKLAHRVSAFLLVALALILIGNSVLFYVVSRAYLDRRFDEQLQSSLNTLVAAVEVEDDDVKWEPSDHTVTLGVETGVEDVRWWVYDEQGRVVDFSKNLQPTFTDVTLGQPVPAALSAQLTSPNWRSMERRLAAPHPKPEEERTSLERAVVTVVVARSLADLTATLNWLLGSLALVPALCWLGSALMGRWYCQHAIAPVRKMAQSARQLDPEDTQARLTVTKTGDELEDLGAAFNDLLDMVFLGYERQRRFASDAAHQLRTPLTVLQGQVDLALRKDRAPAEYVATLTVVRNQIQTLRQMTEALLFLARPNHDGELPDMQPIPLAEWLDRYRERWRAEPRQGDLQVEVDRGLICLSSPGLLAQLLDILISNALKYSPPNSPIALRAGNHQRNFWLEVSDRGMGIAPEELDSLFQPFFRSREVRQAGIQGTGLGLAIARRIADALGGSLRCESHVGAGSRFILELPHAADGG